MWRDFREVPRPDYPLHRLQQSILSDTLGTTEHQGVVDLVGWPLDAMGEPFQDVIAVAAKHLAHMVEPRTGLRGLPRLDDRRLVEIEAGDAVPLNPTTVRD